MLHTYMLHMKMRIINGMLTVFAYNYNQISTACSFIEAIHRFITKDLARDGAINRTQIISI